MSPEPGAGTNTPASAFAELLRRHRQHKGMTQEEFAAAAGVGVRTLRDLERGRARPQRATVDLPGHLAGRPALLLVDAVDRAADATSAALRWLQGIIPSLRIIATGRHPTRIPGEYVWPVGPLETPPAGIVDLAEIARYPAAQLFLDRLRAVGRTELGPDDVAAVAELVRRLGGLPLALELAAARGRILAVPEILNRYGDRVLDLGGAVDTGSDDLARPLRPGGEMTLRDAIAASYRLLDPADRWALRRLA